MWKQYIFVQLHLQYKTWTTCCLNMNICFFKYLGSANLASFCLFFNSLSCLNFLHVNKKINIFIWENCSSQIETDEEKIIKHLFKNSSGNLKIVFECSLKHNLKHIHTTNITKSHYPALQNTCYTKAMLQLGTQVYFVNIVTTKQVFALAMTFYNIYCSTKCIKKKNTVLYYKKEQPLVLLA